MGGVGKAAWVWVSLGAGLWAVLFPPTPVPDLSIPPEQRSPKGRLSTHPQGSARLTEWRSAKELRRDAPLSRVVAGSYFQIRLLEGSTYIL